MHCVKRQKTVLVTQAHYIYTLQRYFTLLAKLLLLRNHRGPKKELRSLNYIEKAHSTQNSL